MFQCSNKDAVDAYAVDATLPRRPTCVVNAGVSRKISLEGFVDHEASSTTITQHCCRFTGVVRKPSMVDIGSKVIDTEDHAKDSVRHAGSDNHGVGAENQWVYDGL